VTRGPLVTPVEVRERDLAQVRWTADGLVAAIAQHRDTGRVLMLGWMNQAALRETLETGRMVYWSRSRKERWAKGDTSGNRQWVREAYYDCDGDVLLFLVDQEGEGACHTGAFSCFYRRFGADPVDADEAAAAANANANAAPAVAREAHEPGIGDDQR
jgi:phosphoribosyl-AMP cyclohydrolase/phosphoribosyl-ATP pyrophosphohydrolase/phosphoribosyl-AMP cyclohydrolase